VSTTTKDALAHLQQIAAERQNQRATTPATLTLGEVRDLNARIAWLTDTVVMAAALYFEEIEDPREADFASESLHELALDLVRENPRLKGGFKGGA
jgi:hypothetical protein